MALYGIRKKTEILKLMWQRYPSGINIPGLEPLESELSKFLNGEKVEGRWVLRNQVSLEQPSVKEIIYHILLREKKLPKEFVSIYYDQYTAYPPWGIINTTILSIGERRFERFLHQGRLPDSLRGTGLWHIYHKDKDPANLIRYLLGDDKERICPAVALPYLKWILLQMDELNIIKPFVFVGPLTFLPDQLKFLLKCFDKTNSFIVVSEQSYIFSVFQTMKWQFV